ncbi:MAG: hypothetical protein ABFC98_05750 [Candidatus Cloacimonas sp.]
MVNKRKTIDLVYYFEPKGWCFSKDGQLIHGFKSQDEAEQAMKEYYGITEEIKPKSYGSLMEGE